MDLISKIGRKVGKGIALTGIILSAGCTPMDIIGAGLQNQGAKYAISDPERAQAFNSTSGLAFMSSQREHEMNVAREISGRSNGGVYNQDEVFHRLVNLDNVKIERDFYSDSWLDYISKKRDKGKFSKSGYWLIEFRNGKVVDVAHMVYERGAIFRKNGYDPNAFK